MERNEKMMKLKLIELMPLIQVHIDVLIFDFQPVHDAVLILIWKIKIIGGDACDGNIGILRPKTFDSKDQAEQPTWILKNLNVFYFRWLAKALLD